jgi:hypothetical protein
MSVSLFRPSIPLSRTATSRQPPCLSARRRTAPLPFPHVATNRNPPSSPFLPHRIGKKGTNCRCPQFLPLILTLLRPRVSKALLWSTYAICPPLTVEAATTTPDFARGRCRLLSLGELCPPPLCLLSRFDQHLTLPYPPPSCGDVPRSPATAARHLSLRGVAALSLPTTSMSLSHPMSFIAQPCFPRVSPCTAEPCAADVAHRGPPLAALPRQSPVW